MSSARIDSKEGLGAAWAGVGAAGAMPERASHRRATDRVRAPGDDRPATRASWARVALRVVRNAAIGLALLSTIPFGFVANRSAAFIPEMSQLLQKTSETERWRDFRAPVDASISPQAAGDALRRITTLPSREHYALRAVTTTHARPWNSITLAPELFPSLRTAQYKGPAAFMLIAKTSGGYSAGEMAYLHEVAEAPFWKDFDAVALAAQVDMVGGLYETPFSAEAQLMAFPFMNLTEAKQTASAGVARATYYLASGHPAEAERVLRTIVSFGFMFIDQGHTLLDAMTGRIVVDIGRNALQQLYRHTGQSELAARVAPPPQTVKTVARARAAPVDLEAARVRALAVIADARAPRALRVGALEELSYGGSCGSVRAMAFGPSEELRDALTTARASMARYPSEQALFDLIDRNMQHGPRVEGSAWFALRVASGTAEVLSAVTGNPRFAACTRLATSIYTY
ncbi:MAG: hypothetical protein P3C10_04790 [Gemmatimonadota bacterium]|nr:hypothetical protein [Gemmatimonadota bacterium]